MSELRFDGRLAVITGGRRGLGAAYARLLAGRGCKVVINDVGASMRGDGNGEDPAHDLAAEIRVGGEMFVAMGGRMARAFIAESQGEYRPEWTVEDVAANIGAIRDIANPVSFAPVPAGEMDHLKFGFGMVAAG